jgi:hypothetical protein
MPDWQPKFSRSSWSIAAVYGSSRIHAVLKERGVQTSRKRVLRLMQQLGISAQVNRVSGKLSFADLD